VALVTQYSATIDPGDYEAWYQSPRGRWIAGREFALLQALLPAQAGDRLLDVGCGTGHFSRRFQSSGLQVTGLDPDPAMLAFARAQTDGVRYLQGRSERLPFVDGEFDYAAAITSLCFVADPRRALAELWRVSRHGVVLGLLNRHSLLYRQKRGSGSYAGARWDTWEDARVWIGALTPEPAVVKHGTAIFLPSGSRLARLTEQLLPGQLPWGGFLALYLGKVAA
jgi:SAM-dependent methyltransferase